MGRGATWPSGAAGALTALRARPLLQLGGVVILPRMIRLKQSTASQEVPLGPFVDAADGFTAETGLTIANTDVKVWKNGATSMVDKNSGGATHMTGGVYSIVLDATDTSTIGPLVLTVSIAGARPVRVECEVLAAALFDSLFGTLGIAADMQGIIGVAASAAKLGTFTETIATSVVGDTGTTTKIPIAVALTTPPEIVTGVNQLKGKRVVFTTNPTNSDAITGQGGHVIASGAPYLGGPGGVVNLVDLTIEPAMAAAPQIGDILTIMDGGDGSQQTGDAFARLPTLTSGGHVKASVESVQDSTAAADRLRKQALAAASGTLAAGSTTSVLQLATFTPTLTEANQLRGRVVLIVDDAASEAALKIQGGRIASNTTGAITLEQPLTRTPAAGNVFVVV